MNVSQNIEDPAKDAGKSSHVKQDMRQYA